MRSVFLIIVLFSSYFFYSSNLYAKEAQTVKETFSVGENLSNQSNGDTSVYDLVVDSQGRIIVVGETGLQTFPIKDPLILEHNFASTDKNNIKSYTGGVYGGSQFDALMMIRDKNGELICSTYLAGDRLEQAMSVRVDKKDFIYVNGLTKSSIWPIYPDASYGENRSWNRDCFVMKFEPGSCSQLVYSTVFGGKGNERCRSHAVDDQGRVYTGGQIDKAFDKDTHLITPDAFQTQYGGGVDDGIFVKLDKNGKDILCATYMGGSDSDFIQSVAYDGQEFIYLTGMTQSKDFPFFKFENERELEQNSSDAFIAKLRADDCSVVYSRRFGGSGYDYPFSMSVDPVDNSVVVVGATTSADFPLGTGKVLKNRFDGKMMAEGFVTRFNSEGEIIKSTYFGGSSVERINDVAFDEEGQILIAGYTYSSDFPTTDADSACQVDPILDDASTVDSHKYFDAFFAKLSSDLDTLLYSSCLGKLKGKDIFYALSLDPREAKIYFVGTSSHFNLSSSTTNSEDDPNHLTQTNNTVQEEISETWDGQLMSISFRPDIDTSPMVEHFEEEGFEKREYYQPKSEPPDDFMEPDSPSGNSLASSSEDLGGCSLRR